MGDQTFFSRNLQRISFFFENKIQLHLTKISHKIKTIGSCEISNKCINIKHFKRGKPTLKLSAIDRQNAIVNFYSFFYFKIFYIIFISTHLKEDY